MPKFCVQVQARLTLSAISCHRHGRHRNPFEADQRVYLYATNVSSFRKRALGLPGTDWLVYIPNQPFGGGREVRQH